MDTEPAVGCLFCLSSSLLFCISELAVLKAAFQEDFLKNGQNGFLTSVILHFFCVNPWLLLCIEVFSTFMSWAIHTHLADFGGKAFLVKDHLSSLPCLILVADQVAQKPPSSAPIIVNFCRLVNHQVDAVGLLQLPCLLQHIVARSSSSIGLHVPA